MASDELRGVGTYRRYKLGQAQFTNWLQQTADKLVPQKSSEPPRQQQKKQSAANAAASSFFGVNPQQDSVPFFTKPIIHWKQLEWLIMPIANPAEILPAAIDILRDVVTLRRKMTKVFLNLAKKTQDPKIQKDNLGHLHINNVLENVPAKLESIVPWAAGSSSKAKTEQAARKESSMVEVSDLTNMFTHLKVQKTDDSGSESQSDEERATINKRPQKQSKRKAAAKKPSKGKKPEKQQGKHLAKTQRPWIDDVEFELTPMETDDYDDEFDYYMMVYCFFVDFSAIRDYVAERWCDYWYDRSVSLTTLAVITNAAFELFNRMEGELIANLEPRRRELSRYYFMLRLLFIDFGIDHVDYDSYEGLSKDEEQERIWREESDWLAFSSYCAIVFVLKNIPPGKVPMLPPLQRSPIIYGANVMNSWKKFSDNVSLQLVKEAAHLKALKKNGQEFPILPAEPEILLDFQTALNSRMYTSALIFSVHLWVDIRNIMENQVSDSLQELQKTASELQPILIAHAPGKDSREGHKLREQFRERITEISSYMLNDCQYEDAKARLMQLGFEEDPEKFFLLKNEPVWAGLMNFRLQLIRSELGHQFTALTSIVEAAGYLYLACRTADNVLPAWEEMDRYIDTYTNQSQFKSTLRSCATPESVIRNFEKVMTAHQAAVKEWENPNSTEGTFIPDVRTRRTLYRRYAWEDPSDRCSMRYLMEITVHKLQIERNDFDEVLPPGIKEAELAKERDFKRGAMLAQLSHVEMLQLLDETVTSQLEGLFRLDYFKLYDEAVAFLRAVVYDDAFGYEFKERVGYSKFDDKTTGTLGKVPVHLVKNLEEEKESGIVLDTLIKVFKYSLEELFPRIPEEMKKKLDSGGGARVVLVDMETGKEVKELD
ncbi:hypothetical protein V8F33_004641 [Rhypophila sp. PSN 637]